MAPVKPSANALVRAYNWVNSILLWIASTVDYGACAAVCTGWPELLLERDLWVGLSPFALFLALPNWLLALEHICAGSGCCASVRSKWEKNGSKIIARVCCCTINPKTTCASTHALTEG